MIDGMQIKSNRGFERSLNNYRLKYIHHLNYWKNTRKTNHWITDENPLFSHQVSVTNECQFYPYRKPILRQKISSPTESMDSGIHVTMERIAVNDDERPLPSGWERCEDEQGVYYWHKGTGTVTRDRPESIVDSPSLTLSTSSSSNETSFESNSLLYKSESDTSIRVTSEPNEMHPCQARARVQTIADPKAQHRFHVCSLGWTTLHEEDLTSERSSRSVNRCIYELTRSIDDSVSRWGDGKDLYMDISHTDILLIDPMEMTIVDRQSIPAIRIWGVGRENSRDFAYVAKDKDRASKTYKCHVFRCDNTSARTIANTLRDICRNLMIERGLLQTTKDMPSSAVSMQLRPTSFPNSIDNAQGQTSFPTPIEESKKDLLCQYLGCMNVEKPGGMEILRPAVEQVAMDVPEERWIPVKVHISPTSINICSDDDSKEQILDCRIRYLSFLGVGQNTSFCGIIVHCADNSFKCHVFHCQPSCTELCKNIEAACKLRYQKCLDAHSPVVQRIVQSKSYSAQLKNLVESFWFGNK